VSATTTPNLIRESLAHFLGCVVDGSSSGIVAASGVLRNGLGVLCKRTRAGIVLTGSLSDSDARHRLPQPRIAGLTKPSEIIRRAV
jgi:hypothetical protein